MTINTSSPASTSSYFRNNPALQKQLEYAGIMGYDRCMGSLGYKPFSLRLAQAVAVSICSAYGKAATLAGKQVLCI